MRVLAVGEVGDLPEGERQLVGEVLVLGEPARDRRVVGGRDRERLGGERAARLGREPAVRRARRAPGRTARAGTPARRGRSSSRRRAGATGPPTSIISMMSASSTPMPPGERRERIEVHADDVERLDPVLGERGAVLVQVEPGEDAGVNRRVERLHAARRASRARAVTSSTRVTSSPCSSRNAAVPPEETSSNPSCASPAANVVDAVLVVDGDERPHAAISPATVSGRRRCSTAWRRSSSVSRGSTGTGSCTRIGPGVDALVDEVHRDAGRLDAGGQRVLDRIRAGEGGQERGVDVDDPARENGPETGA